VHIIACTQRASVKVVDGDIKANLPCRIALRLPTEIDSRLFLELVVQKIFLEKVICSYQRPEKDIIERFSWPYVSMDDIQNLVCNYNEIRGRLVIRRYLMIQTFVIQMEYRADDMDIQYKNYLNYLIMQLV